MSFLRTWTRKDQKDSSKKIWDVCVSEWEKDGSHIIKKEMKYNAFVPQ